MHGVYINITSESDSKLNAIAAMLRIILITINTYPHRLAHGNTLHIHTHIIYM